MDEYRLWQDDYRREVEEVLAVMRRKGGSVASSTAPSPTQALPPAGVMRELADARAELEKLRPAVDELRRALAVRDAEAAREARRRGRFKDLAVRLSTAVRRLDEELTAQRRRLREEGLRSKDLALRLRAALQARRRASGDLVLEQRKLLQYAADSRVLQGRINELELAFDAKAQALSSLQARADAAARAYEERAAAREALISDLTGKLEREREERRRLAERAEAEAARLKTERDAVFRRLEETAGELAARRDEQDRGRRELEGARAEISRVCEELEALKKAAGAGAASFEKERAAFQVELERAAEQAARLRAEAAEAARAKAAAEEIAEGARRADEEARRRENEALQAEKRATENLEKAARLAAQAEAAKSAAVADAARLRDDALRIVEEKRREVDDERRQIEELRQSAARAAAERAAGAARRAEERRRIARETLASIEKAERVLAEEAAAPLPPAPAAPAPMPESPKPEPKIAEKPAGLLGRLRRLWKRDE